MYSLGRLLIGRNIFGMQSSTSAYKLTHNEEQSEFHMLLKNDIAKVKYERNGNVFDLLHSEVPASMRGKGIGNILAKTTFDYIDENNWKMIVTCDFLRRVYEENKNQYVHLIKE